MREFFRLLTATPLILLLFLAPSFGEARKPDPALAGELGALLSDPNRGFAASGAALGQSFARHLGGPRAPQSVAELASLPAAYDPASATRFTAGLLYYHLARPITFMRETGSPRLAYLAGLIELRLLWLAGHPAAARDRALTLLAETDAPDARLASLLADAAVLSHRLGHIDQARALFARARICTAPRCPGDIVFDWLGPARQPAATPFAGYDPAAMLRQATADAPALFPTPAPVLAEAALEARLMQGGAMPLLSKAISDALQAEGADALPAAERRRFRDIADRLAGYLDFEAYLMGSDSVAGAAAAEAGSGRSITRIDLTDIGYLGTTFSGLITGNLPILADLLRLSDRRGDVVVARLIEARILMAYGALDRAKEALLRLRADARAGGHSDAELQSVLLDLWAVSMLTKDRALAQEALDATRRCRKRGCTGDLTLAFFAGAGALPEPPFTGNFNALKLQAAERFVTAHFPGDRLKLADLYATGPSQSHPMDAARHAELSIRYAEGADGIAPVDLTKRAARAMDTLVYAGKYAAAAEIGDRIETRLQEAGAEAALTGYFYQVRARAAHRLDDPAARRFYDAAIRRGGNEDLALDLLDTSYLDLLDTLIEARGTWPSLRARLRFRQGRPAEAAEAIAEARLYWELTEGAPFLRDVYAAQAATHLRGRSLDAYLAARLRVIALANPENMLQDDDPIAYANLPRLKALAFQEAYYRAAAEDSAEAARLRALGGTPEWFTDDWAPLPERPEAAALALFEARAWQSDDSYDLIRDLIEMRDRGDYEAAARMMKSRRWVAIAAEANGAYVDAQALWQMAFTFARVGETDIAFDLMNRAARIAANLSFQGAGGADGGTLQLLERDRWRYLLFVDIAWAAMSGQPPEEMLVVSRY